jgi:hypothetical protein
LNGTLIARHSVFFANSGVGGAISNGSGTLIVRDSAFFRNSGSVVSAFAGGVIESDTSTQPIVITSSAFIGNSDTAVLILGGPARVNDSVFFDNGGGGIQSVRCGLQRFSRWRS